MIKEGQKAPSFTLPGAEGDAVTLKDYLGKPVVLYFYPEDDTPAVPGRRARSATARPSSAGREPSFSA